MNKEKKEKKFYIYTNEKYSLYKNGVEQRLTFDYDEFIDKPWEFNEGFLTTMYCWHRNYNLGHEKPYNDICDCLSYLAMEESQISDALKNKIEKAHENATYEAECELIFKILNKHTDFVVVKLECYENYGDAVVDIVDDTNTSVWEHSNNGIAFISKKRLINMGCIKENTRNWRAVARKIIQNEVAFYNTYLKGEVYNFCIQEITHCKCCGDEHAETVDACGGFYGDDLYTNGMYENLPDEWQQYFDNLVNGGAKNE